jgi:hypothetical protein
MRNLTGDADGAFAGNPRVFKFVPQAVKELTAAYSTNKQLTGDIKDWFDRGGTISTLQAQEMGELNKLITFAEKFKSRKFSPNIWRNYWKVARLSTDFRESILRYAAYLEALDQQAKNNGKIINYGASKPEEIDGLADPKDKAYWLQNDLLGAYDRIGVLGQSVREHLIPFWSWQEVNMRRYVQLFRNAANDNRLAGAVGRKLVGTIGRVPFRILALSKFFIKASALLAAVYAWNRMMFPDDDNDLPEDVRGKAHITFGRDENGKINYFSRIGALGDLLEWLNLDASPTYVKEFMHGRMTARQIAKDMALKSPVNKIVQGMTPFLKLGYETLTRRSFYPDLWKPGVIRDRGEYIARSFGMGSEYQAIFQKPSLGYAESLPENFIYKSDPLESAYWDIQGVKRRFKDSIGEGYEGFFLSNRSMALYNIKRAIRYRDYKSADLYLKEYGSLGGTLRGLQQSLAAMSPDFGIKPEQRKQFVNYMDAEERQKFLKAVVYYDQIMAAAYGNIPARGNEVVSKAPPVAEKQKLNFITK